MKINQLVIFLVYTFFLQSAFCVDTYVFSPGFGESQTHKNYYQRRGAFTQQCHVVSYDPPEIARWYMFFVKTDRTKVSLGQADDINALYQAVQSLNKTSDKSSGFIGYGVSKGASTWINTAATFQLDGLRALVLDAPFAEVDGVLAHLAESIGMKSIFINPVRKFFLKNLLYPKYSPSGLQPLHCVKDVPDIPIIFFHSCDDEIIPINHSRQLYLELLKQGRKNIYLVEIPSGLHANLLSNDNPKSKAEYLSALHTFYKKYDLPYDERYVSTIDLAIHQPSIDVVQKAIHQKTKPIEIKRLMYTGIKQLTLKI